MVRNVFAVLAFADVRPSLRVLIGPPRVEVRSLVYGRKGAEHFELHCNVRSPPDPKPNIIWKRGDDDLITDDGHYEVVSYIWESLSCCRPSSISDTLSAENPLGRCKSSKYIDDPQTGAIRFRRLQLLCRESLGFLGSPFWYYSPGASGGISYLRHIGRGWRLLSHIGIGASFDNREQKVFVSVQVVD